MAIGVYTKECLWEKKGTTNKYNSKSFDEPITLKCSQSVEKIYVRDDKGERLVYKATFNFPDTRVQQGDKLNGFLVTAVAEGRGFNGELLSYKVVVDNA